MPACTSCGAELDSTVRFCPKCGQPAEASAGAPPPHYEPATRPDRQAAAAQDQNLLSALAYLLVPAVIFLFVEPYKSNKFIRFHSYQSLLLAAAYLAVQVTLGVLASVLSVIGIGFLIAFFVGPLVSLAMFALWIFVIIKAFQGAEYRLPIIGEMAARQV